MPPRHRALRVALVALGVLVVAAGLAWRYLLPGIAAGAIRSALRDRGLPDARFVVARADAGGLVLREIVLDAEGRLRADAVEAEYGLGDLLRGRVRSVRVRGLRFVARVAEGRLDLGPVQSLLAAGGDDGAEETTAPPLDTVLLTDAEIVLLADGETWTATAAGRADFAADGEARVALTAEALGHSLAVAGRLDLTGRTPGRLAASFSGRCESLRAGGAAARGLSLDGEAAAVLPGMGGSDGALLSLVLHAGAEAVEVGGAAVEHPALDVEAETRLPPAGRRGWPPRTDARFTARALSAKAGDLAGVALGAGGEVRLAGGQVGRADLDLSARAIGVPDWTASQVALRLTTLPSASISTVPPTLGIEGTGLAEGLEVSLSAGPLPADPRDWAGWDRDVTARVSATGPIPERLRRLLTDAGVTFEGLPGVTDWISATAWLLLRLSSRTVTVTEAEVALQETGDVGLPGGPTLSGLSARARLAGEWRDGTVSARVLPGATIAATWPREEVTAEAETTAEAAFTRPAGGAWSASAPEVRVAVRTEGVRALPGGVLAVRPRASLRLRAEAAGNPGEALRAECGALDGSLLSAEAVHLGGDDPWLSLGAQRYVLAAGSGVRIEGGAGSGIALVARGTVHADQAVRFAGPAVSGRLRRVRIGGEFTRGPAGGPSGHARVEAALDRALFAGPEVRLDDVVADLAVRLADGHLYAEPGRIGVGEVAARGRLFPAVTVAVPASDVPEEVPFVAEWAPRPGAVLAARGRALLEAEGPRVEATFDLPPCGVREGDPLHAALGRDTDLSVVGTLGLAGRFSAGPEGAVFAADVRVKDARVSHREGIFAVEGLSVAARLAGPDPLRTESEGTVSFSGGTIGTTPVGAGSLRFALAAPDALTVTDLRWRMGSTGRFSATPFTFDPAAPDIRTEVACEDYDLADWLSLVSFDKVRGEGKVSGRVPLRLRTGPPLGLEIGEGTFAATGPGLLAVQDAATAEQILRGSLPQDEYGALVTDRVVQALLDFSFDRLTFRFLRKGSGITLSANATGRGRKVPQGLDLTVNLNDIDRALRQALAVKLGLDRLKSRLER